MTLFPIACWPLIGTIARTSGTLWTSRTWTRGARPASLVIAPEWRALGPVVTIEGLRRVRWEAAWSSLIGRSGLRAPTAAFVIPTSWRTTLPLRWLPCSPGRTRPFRWPTGSRIAVRHTTRPKQTLVLRNVLIGHSNCLAQLQQFTVREIAELTTRDVSELERSDSRSNQLRHWITDLVEHASNDPVASFVEDDANDKAVLGVLDRTHHRRFRALPIDDDPPAKSLESCRWRKSVEQCLVLLVDLEARVHDAVRDFAIVGEQE
jgi:hypothetical protein